jgi:hypothetical protein
MLSAALLFSFRFLAWMQQKMTAARIRAAPRMEPRTMPAMAPPESPDPDWLLPAPAPPVAEGTPEDVLEGKSGCIDRVVGRVTPTQRLSTLEVTQHESVELTVLS